MRHTHTHIQLSNRTEDVRKPQFDVNRFNLFADQGGSGLHRSLHCIVVLWILSSVSSWKWYFIRSLCGTFHSNLWFCTDLVDKSSMELTDGWPWLNRKRDDIDYEWEAFKVHTTKYAYWLICHALLTEIVRFLAPKVVSSSNAKTPHGRVFNIFLRFPLFI